MAFDSSSESTSRLIDMAGSQRLPANVRRGEMRDESGILRVLEAAVYEYTKGIPSKDLHDKKKTSKLYEDISNILDRFDCVAKGTFRQAWKSLLCGDVINLKEVLETIGSVACNRTLQHYITNQLRTPAKYKETLKRILHMGGSFESLFEEVGLNSVELAQKAHRIASDAKLCATLSSMIDTETFTSDPDIIVQQFYKVISGVQSDLHRNEYYNKFLLKLVSMKAISVQMITIFVQVYCFYMTSESIRTVDSRITKYLAANPIDFFTHQVRHMPLKLQPNSNFKREGFRLDAWQEECLQAIDEGKNLLMSARTSAGKTVLSTHAIRNYTKVWYIVPSDPLGYQLAGIILASLLDLELLKGSVKKNLHLAMGSTRYKRFPQADNIIVATPEQLVRLIQSTPMEVPEYIILDEFHNLQGSQGPFYEYLLKFAGFHSVPLMALSATIPNFEEVQEWLRRLLPGPLFAVNLQKRFFNQKRMTFRNGELVTINPLHHLTIEQIRCPTFQQIGLYPQEILSLYESLPSVSRIDGVTPRLVSLDEMERLELTLFDHLKHQTDATLSTIVRTSPLESDTLTLYQLYNFLRGVTIKPMIIFKMDSFQCLTLFTKFVKLIQAYNKLVYGGFNGDKHIIREYLEEADRFEDSAKLSITKEEDVNEIEEKKKAMKELLFNSKYKPRLYAFYDTFLEETPKDYSEFNELYGAELTYDMVLKLRQKHVRAEKRHAYDTITVRSTYTIHHSAMIAHTDGSIMRDIRDKINDELQYQQKLNGAFHYEYKDYEIEDNRISYEHPVLVGIECGLLFYNQLMNPALTRICQQLISKYPLIVLSDKSLTVGINYPIKTVLLLGGLTGEPIEEIDTTTAHQGAGRAGRRGLDAEGIVIYSGVNITKILTPDYHPVRRNPVEAMTPLLSTESSAFQTFVRTEVRPPPAPATAVPVTAPVTAPVIAEKIETVIEKELTLEEMMAEFNS